MKDRILMFGLGIMTTVAAAGWMQRPSTTPSLMPVSYQGAGLDPSIAPSPFASPTATSAVYSASGRPMPVTQARPATRVAYDQPAVAPRPVVRRASTYGNSDSSYGEPVRTQRSTGKSVAIVAGSAATGAAIGGLAGGGKGAAIGAITAGIGGLVYDRMTHKKNDKILPW